MTELADKHFKRVSLLSKSRAQLLQDAHGNPLLQTKIKEKCRREMSFFFDFFIFGVDPRTKPSTFPLVLFPKQMDALKWMSALKEESITNKKKTHIGTLVKARDTGLSVITSGWMLYYWLFEKDFQGAFGSRKETLVWNPGNEDSLFQKVQSQLDNLPSWMQPTYKVKKMLMLNKDNGSTIKGEAGSNIGRGGRNSVYMIDEAAFLQHQDSVLAAVSRNTDCLVLFSTPNGTNKFREMYENDAIASFKVRWSDDPRRTQEWYDEQVLIFGKEIVEQELNCNFDASIDGQLIDARWYTDGALNYFEDTYESPKHIANLWDYHDIVAAADLSGEGKDSTVFAVRHGAQVMHIERWNSGDPAVDANRILELCRQFNVKHFYFDKTGGYGGVMTDTLRKGGKLKFTWEGIQFGSATSHKYWAERSQKSSDFLLNRRAEMYWILRERFKKTYLTRQGIREYEPHELIGLPQNEHIKKEIGVLTYVLNPAGKIQLISKQELRKQGIPSPDVIDTLAMLFNPSMGAKRSTY